MHKFKLFTLFSLCGLFLTTLSSCGVDEYEYLRVLNSEDYIYTQDTEIGYYDEDLTIQFEKYMLEEHGRKVRVVYDTFDTNENMMNSLKTGKSHYDVICASDYILQKMMKENMLHPFKQSELEYYNSYASPYLRNQFKNIKGVNKVSGEECSLDDYAVGYMWGTLGILYNPTYSTIADRVYKDFGYTGDDLIAKVQEDMSDWNVLWDPFYKSTISIKDSMRDTYAVGILHAFDELFTSYKEQYDNGLLTQTEYNKLINTVFNYGGEKDPDAVSHIEQVQNALMSLRDNIFGFEVDSGKEDIVTRKIGVNIAWSGDAVYSIDKAENPEETSEPFELYYSIPEKGANIWFDAWVMHESSELNVDLAHKWVDFLSNPINAAQNMDYLGYTPFIGGKEIIELVREWYDGRAFELYMVDEDDEYIYDDDGNHIIYEEYNGITVDTYPEADILDLGYEKIDLSYFFNGTYDPNEFDSNAGIFYVDTLGRQFTAQYPSPQDIPHLAIMEDYGINNDLILKMWEEVKSEPLPAWGFILLGAELLVFGGGLLILFINKKTSYNNRKKNRKKD